MKSYKTTKPPPVKVINGISIYKRTFEAKSETNPDRRAILNLSSVTSEYQTSHKYSIINFSQISDTARTLTDAIGKANLYSNNRNHSTKQ